MLMGTLEQWTPGTKRAMFKATLTIPQSKRSEEMQPTLRTVEQLIKKHEVVIGQPWVTVIID